MAQVTEAFARQMLVHYERGEHAPLTTGEERQLAYAWLALQEARRTVGFFASVIKSGEPWTPECQAAFDRVFSEGA